MSQCWNCRKYDEEKFMKQMYTKKYGWTTWCSSCVKNCFRMSDSLITACHKCIAGMNDHQKSFVWCPNCEEINPKLKDVT